METPKSKGIVVFGGGTATNSLVDILEHLRQSRNCDLSYIIPISDNGGSSSELIRVFGGPGIGDVRSRLVRLIPDSDSDSDRAGIKKLFNYRLSSESQAARTEWLDIVEGRHEIWRRISSEKRELIRSFFNLVNMEVVKRARPSSVFSFAKASVGNLFLTGARLFSGSFESAIYLLSTLCGIPSTTAVLPAITSNFTHHICAGLADGSHITGQNSISHPSAPTSVPVEQLTLESGDQQRLAPGLHHDRETEEHDRIEDATLPGSLPTLRKPYIEFHKAGDGEDELPSRIDRIWYINPYGHEIWPVPNTKVISTIDGASAVIYSIGSLYTSIIPSLILRGVGNAIANTGVRSKILILNSSNDRETGPSSQAFTATDFVKAIARAAAQSQGVLSKDDRRAEVLRYVTHIIHMEGEGTPPVDKDELAKLGVTCIRVYGRKVDDMLRYDEVALARTLEAILGRGEMTRSRRNTSGQ